MRDVKCQIGARTEQKNFSPKSAALFEPLEGLAPAVKYALSRQHDEADDDVDGIAKAEGELDPNDPLLRKDVYQVLARFSVIEFVIYVYYEVDEEDCRCQRDQKMECNLGITTKLGGLTSQKNLALVRVLRD